MKLRRYQERTVENFLKWKDTEGNLATIILPTGTGKTFTATQCIEAAPNNKYLWVAHRKELIDQAFSSMQKSVSWTNKISKEIAANKASANSDIIIGSVQTLASTKRKHLDGFTPDFIIIDEYHHMSENNITYQGLLNKYPKAKIIGLTATPYRFGGDPLPIGDVLFEMDIGTAITHKYLVPAVPEILKSNVSLANVKTSMGDFATKELSRAVNTKERNELIAKRILSLVKDEKRQGLLFGVDVSHAHDMYDMLKDEIRTAEIYGSTDSDERDYLVNKVKNGEIDCLVNNMVCLDDQTEILTRQGWRTIDTISLEDDVANWDNGKVYFENPKRIVKRDRKPNEKMVILQTNKRSIRVTEDHELLYRNNLNDSFVKDKAINLCDKKIRLPVSGLGPTLENVDNINKHLNWLWQYSENEFAKYIKRIAFNGGNLLSHINKDYLSAIQAVACCRGYLTHLNQIPIDGYYLLTLKKKSEKFGKLKIEDAEFKDEKVWCVETSSHNIITRRLGSVTVMGNCTEGFDSPNLSFAAIARPTRSLGLFIQMVGRVLRINEGKENAIILDVYDKLKVKQSRVTFDDMVYSGDMDGEKKRANNILYADINLDLFTRKEKGPGTDDIAKKLINFPTFIVNDKQSRWTVDDEFMPIASWVLSKDQRLITWGEEFYSNTIVDNTNWTQLNIKPSLSTIKQQDIRVKHDVLGIGVLVDIGFGTEVKAKFGNIFKYVSISELMVNNSIINPAIEASKIKVDRVFYLCFPMGDLKGRVIEMTKAKTDLVIHKDELMTKRAASEYIVGLSNEKGVFHLIRSNAAWKKSTISPAQKELINNMILSGRIRFDLDLDTLTKGDASAIIEQVKWQKIINDKFGTDNKNKLIGYDVSAEDV